MDEVKNLENGDEVKTHDVPFIVHESALARMERQTKRLFILSIIIFAALVGTNGAWLWHESQYVDEEMTVTQDVDTGEGSATVVGVGDIYGESETNGNTENAD